MLVLNNRLAGSICRRLQQSRGGAAAWGLPNVGVGHSSTRKPSLFRSARPPAPPYHTTGSRVIFPIQGRLTITEEHAVRVQPRAAQLVLRRYFRSLNGLAVAGSAGGDELRSQFPRNAHETALDTSRTSSPRHSLVKCAETPVDAAVMIARRWAKLIGTVHNLDLSPPASGSHCRDIHEGRPPSAVAVTLIRCVAIGRRGMAPGGSAPATLKYLGMTGFGPKCIG